MKHTTETLIISTDFVKGLRNGHLKIPMMIALRRSESFADCFGIIMTPAMPGVSRCQSQVVRTTDLGKKCYTLRQEIESHPVFQGFQKSRAATAARTQPQSRGSSFRPQEGEHMAAF